MNERTVTIITTVVIALLFATFRPGQMLRQALDPAAQQTTTQQLK